MTRTYVAVEDTPSRSNFPLAAGILGRTHASIHGALPLVGRRSIPAALHSALLVVTLVVSGCNESPTRGAADPSASAAAGPKKSTPASRPSNEQLAQWLSTDLPPIVEGLSDPPVRLSDPVLAPNEFGQEILKVPYDRPAIVRTMAADLCLVLLPTIGGRVNVFMHPGILVEPRSSGRLQGITENHLDHRGRFRSGMRAYLEMHAATAFSTGRKAERVSDVIWLGSDDQLSDAVRQGPPPRAAENNGSPAPELQPVPSGRITMGTPAWMRCGDRWSRGNVLEDSSGDRIRLLIYLVRRDKPYLPWAADLSRQDLRFDQAVFSEFQRDPGSFRDLADANDLKLSRHGVPVKLEPVVADDLKVGAAVLDFWNGMLDPCRTTGPVKNDEVPIQRVGLDGAQMVKSAKRLFVDPFGEAAAP